jgi:hypothetical protein
MPAAAAGDVACAGWLSSARYWKSRVIGVYFAETRALLGLDISQKPVQTASTLRYERARSLCEVLKYACVVENANKMSVDLLNRKKADGSIGIKH